MLILWTSQFIAPFNSICLFIFAHPLDSEWICVRYVRSELRAAPIYRFTLFCLLEIYLFCGI